MIEQSRAAQRHNFRGAFMVGIGVMAAVDEILFHQILAWHHFYDQSTPLIGLMSDGFLHAAELILLVCGFFLLIRARQAGALMPNIAFAAALLGAGIFQVFDGIIDHKLLRLHQIRYQVDNLFLYDLAWNGFGVVLIIIGALLYARARKLAYST